MSRGHLENRGLATGAPLPRGRCFPGALVCRTAGGHPTMPPIVRCPTRPCNFRVRPDAARAGHGRLPYRYTLGRSVAAPRAAASADRRTRPDQRATSTKVRPRVSGCLVERTDVRIGPCSYCAELRAVASRSGVGPCDDLALIADVTVAIGSARRGCSRARSSIVVRGSGAGVRQIRMGRCCRSSFLVSSLRTWRRRRLGARRPVGSGLR
jgi:hypothetical protein